ncbi:MAG: hypothetical protein ACYC7G_04790 [Rudaea sp.]
MTAINATPTATTHAHGLAGEARVAEYIQAWQCIGCGRIEAPQPCIGVCRDRKVLFIGKDEHEAALAEIARLRAQLRSAASRLQRFGLAAPRPGQWEPAYAALRDEARVLITELNVALEADSADKAATAGLDVSPA